MLKIRRKWLVVLLGFVGWIHALPVGAQCTFTEDQVLLASDAATEDRFGSSIAVHGDVLLVGAPGDDPVLANAGSAYLLGFDGQGWQEIQKLTAASAQTDGRFGSAVALSADLAVVGAEYQGTAHVFRRQGTTWVEEQELRDSGLFPVSHFGGSVSLSGNVIAVGARYDYQNTALPRTGAVYVFRHNGSQWVQEQRLSPARGADLDQFGVSVALDGGYLVVGTPYDDRRGSNRGSATVFQYQGTSWVQLQKLFPNVGFARDLFGSQVAIEGTTVVVGSLEPDRSINSGSAYVYRRQGTDWIQEQRLQPSNRGTPDYFGARLACQGSTILVGAPNRGSGRGNAFLFRFDGSSWQEQRRFRRGDRAMEDHLGYAVALHGDAALASAPGREHASMAAAGSVLAFAAADLALDVDPQTARALDTVSLNACGGLPGAPLLLMVGLPPMQQPTPIVAAFDSEGLWTSAGVYNGNPAMVDVPFTVFTMDASGQLLVSNSTVLSLR
jgi:hypothetical protein